MSSEKKTTELDAAAWSCCVVLEEGGVSGKWRTFPLVMPERSVAETRVFLIRVSKSEVVAGKERFANSLAIRERPFKSLVRSLKEAITLVSSEIHNQNVMLLFLYSVLTN